MSLIYSLASSFPTGFQTAVDSISAGNTASALAGFGVFLMAFIAVFMIFGLAFYIYYSLALMKIADRTNTDSSWLAWIPVGNMVLTAKIADMQWWPILLFIPYFIFYAMAVVFVGLGNRILGMLLMMLAALPMLAFYIFYLIWWYKICEKRDRPGWWALLTLIPFFGAIWFVIMIGILAWSKD